VYVSVFNRDHRFITLIVVAAAIVISISMLSSLYVSASSSSFISSYLKLICGAECFVGGRGRTVGRSQVRPLAQLSRRRKIIRNSRRVIKLLTKLADEVGIQTPQILVAASCIFHELRTFHNIAAAAPAAISSLAKVRAL
jgi:hypothetical protein